MFSNDYKVEAGIVRVIYEVSMDKMVFLIPSNDLLLTPFYFREKQFVEKQEWVILS